MITSRVVASRASLPGVGASLRFQPGFPVPTTRPATTETDNLRRSHRVRSGQSPSRRPG